MKKNILIALLLMIPFGSSFAFASCEEQVATAYRKYVEKKTPNEYRGVRSVSLDYAEESIQESAELSQRAAQKALSAVRKNGVLLFEGESNYMGGTGLDLLVVNAQTCKISKRIYWYAE